MDADNQTSGSRSSFCFHIETLISFWLSVSMETCNGLHSWKQDWGGGSVYSLGWRTTQTVYTKTTLQTLGSVFWRENSKRTLSPTTSHSNSHKWDACTAGSETQSQASRLWSTSELKTLKSFTAVLGTYKSRDRPRVGNWCPRPCKRMRFSVS